METKNSPPSPVSPSLNVSPEVLDPKASDAETTDDEVIKVIPQLDGWEDGDSPPPPNPPPSHSLPPSTTPLPPALPPGRKVVFSGPLEGVGVLDEGGEYETWEVMKLARKGHLSKTGEKMNFYVDLYQTV